MGDASTPHRDGPPHGPFRAWALQHELSSLLGGDPHWRASSELQTGDSVRTPEDAVCGQGHLGQALRTDPRIELRIRTSVVLWGAALATDVANQISPRSIAMPTGSFWLLATCALFGVLISAFVYPRLSESRFVALEQSMLTFATLLIFYQSSVTGGSGSPYTIWFILTSYYSTYLMPAGQALANLAWITLLCVLTLAFAQTEASSTNVLQLAALLISIQVTSFALIHQRRREDTIERAVTFMALADPLTGTANMRAFENYVDELLRSDGQRVALLVADMNGLKGANAVFGQAVGDDMIVRTAGLMQRACSERDQVARFGGDEFAVALPNARAADVVRWRKQFELLVDRHNAAVRGRLPQISVALGSALYPDDGMRVDELIDVADRRMYEAKTPGIAPPHELDGVEPGDAARRFRSAGLHDAPRHAVDVRDRMRLASINWLTCGTLTLVAAAIGGASVQLWPAVACGVFALFVAILAETRRQRRLTRRVSRFIDVSTVGYALPAIWSTGGSASPILIAVVLAISFYAQNFARNIAVPRISLLVAGAVIGFSLGGAHTTLELTYLLTAVVAMLVIATVMQNSQRQVSESLRLLRDSARRDRLTGLPNAIALRSQLEAAIRAAEAGQPAAAPSLLVVDLDDFRRANSLAGHRGGDEVLKAVADTLRRHDEACTAYRIGGDEFVLLCGPTEEAELQEAAARACRSVARQHRLGSTHFAVTATAGHASWRPESTADEMIEQAEAMLRSRKRPRPGSGSGSGRVLL